jgi:hypothetical protein
VVMQRACGSQHLNSLACCDLLVSVSRYSYSAVKVLRAICLPCGGVEQKLNRTVRQKNVLC